LANLQNPRSQKLLFSGKQLLPTFTLKDTTNRTRKIHTPFKKNQPRNQLRYSTAEFWVLQIGSQKGCGEVSEWDLGKPKTSQTLKPREVMASVTRRKW
jgi:hypothetical protein